MFTAGSLVVFLALFGLLFKLSTSSCLFFLEHIISLFYVKLFERESRKECIRVFPTPHHFALA